MFTWVIILGLIKYLLVHIKKVSAMCLNNNMNFLNKLKLTQFLEVNLLRISKDAKVRDKKLPVLKFFLE